MYIECSVLGKQYIDSDCLSNVELPKNDIIPPTKQMFW